MIIVKPVLVICGHVNCSVEYSVKGTIIII